MISDSRLCVFSTCTRQLVGHVTYKCQVPIYLIILCLSYTTQVPALYRPFLLFVNSNDVL